MTADGEVAGVEGAGPASTAETVPWRLAPISSGLEASPPRESSLLRASAPVLVATAAASASGVRVGVAVLLPLAATVAPLPDGPSEIVRSAPREVRAESRLGRAPGGVSTSRRTADTVATPTAMAEAMAERPRGFHLMRLTLARKDTDKGLPRWREPDSLGAANAEASSGNVSSGEGSTDTESCAVHGTPKFPLSLSDRASSQHIPRTVKSSGRRDSPPSGTGESDPFGSKHRMRSSTGASGRRAGRGDWRRSLPACPDSSASKDGRVVASASWSISESSARSRSAGSVGEETPRSPATSRSPSAARRYGM